MANIIKLGGAGSGAGTLITKAITANGTYNATDDQADGYSQVTVNVSGGTIPTLATHSGKLDLTNGTIAANPDYVYTDKFDLPTGTATMDFGNTYGTNAGIVWYDENDNYVNYFQANSRFRQMNMAQYYHAGYKARLGFPVASAYQIFIDNNAGKTMTSFDPTKIT